MRALVERSAFGFNPVELTIRSARGSVYPVIRQIDSVHALLSCSRPRLDGVVDLEVTGEPD